MLSAALTTVWALKFCGLTVASPFTIACIFWVNGGLLPLVCPAVGLAPVPAGPVAGRCRAGFAGSCPVAPAGPVADRAAGPACPAGRALPVSPRRPAEPASPAELGWPVGPALDVAASGPAVFDCCLLPRIAIEP